MVESPRANRIAVASIPISFCRGNMRSGIEAVANRETVQAARTKPATPPASDNSALSVSS